MMRRFWMTLLILCFGVGWIRAQETSADFYVEASVDNPTPFVGQQMIYSVRVYQALDLTETSLLYETPDFEGFWRVEVQPIPFAQTSQQVNGRTYSISEIRTALYPTRPGDLTITPANLVLPETVFRTEQRVGSNTVAVKALPLPEGAPTGFGGAVGQFELAATLDRQSVTLGEPVTLRLTLRGTGNVEQLSPPEVPAPQGWQIFANPSSYIASQDNGRIIGEKVFEWSLIPDQQGSHVLPEISLVYFDPSLLAYRTLNTASTTIEVLPGNADAAASQGSDNAGSDVGGFIPIKPVPSVLGSVSVHLRWFFWLLWLVPPLGVAVSVWWMKREQRRTRNQKAIRRSEALKRAQERLHAAANAPPEQAYHCINEAVFEYLGDKLSRQPKQLSQSDWRRALSERKMMPEVGRRVLNILERADEAQYAPVSAVDARQLAGYTLDTLKLLDAAWEQK